MSFDLLGSLSEDPRQQRQAASAEQDDSAPQCSRRGCREAAVWALEWNNPRVHTPQRRKIWVACHEHREHLAEFLSARGFLKDVKPLAGPPGSDGSATRDQGQDGESGR